MTTQDTQFYLVKDGHIKKRTMAVKSGSVIPFEIDATDCSTPDDRETYTEELVNELSFDEFTFNNKVLAFNVTPTLPENTATKTFKFQVRFSANTGIDYTIKTYKDMG